MYWICFGDSAKGMLAYAKGDIDPEMTHDRIISLYDDYSQGDIREPENRETRMDILAPWRDDPEQDGEWLDDYVNRHYDALKRLDEVDKAVIWCGVNPCEQCGLRYVMSRLSGRGIPVWLVQADEIPASAIPPISDQYKDGAVGVIVTTKKGKQVPIPRVMQPALYRHFLKKQERKRREDAAKGVRVKYSGAGEMKPGAARYFYERRRQLDKTEQSMLADEWLRLQEENAPLRAIVGEKMQSVPENFYDEAIASCAPEREEIAACMVGRAIAAVREQTGNPIGDMQIFRRIRALAAAGRLEIVHDAPSYREMRVRKTGD